MITPLYSKSQQQLHNQLDSNNSKPYNHYGASSNSSSYLVNGIPGAFQEDSSRGGGTNGIYNFGARKASGSHNEKGILQDSSMTMTNNAGNNSSLIQEESSKEAAVSRRSAQVKYSSHMT
jgi:hypothetical protein